MTPERDDLPEIFGGLLGLVDELEQEWERELACTACGRPIRQGEPHRVRQNGRAEHLKYPPVDAPL